MSLPIKHQLSRIVNQLAYKAFGFNIKMSPSQFQLISNNSPSDHITFKLPIPQQIYHQYSEDGFIYSDPGITPKQIADDILVHFKELNHVQMESDEFGNIKATVKDEYFQQKYEKMLNSNKITCLDCNELDFHRKQSVKNYVQEEQNLKELMVLFRKRSEFMTLSELRQNYTFEAIKKIQNQIFHKETGSIEYFEESSYVNSKISLFSRNNYSKIIFACLRHQIIKKQTLIERLFDGQNNKDMNEKFQAIKFGIVIPEQIFIKYPVKDMQKQQTSKLRKIFYDNDIEKPVNLSKINSVDSQFKTRRHKKLIYLPLTIQQLLFTTEQLLSNLKITQLYHLYLLLSHFLNSQKSQISLSSQSQSSTHKTKYMNAARIIKDHLKIILFQEQSLQVY